ncbi:uncharacterized protein [Nicotiana sylvestris]|uniref:uncharacterized protein n=1 Tax=Nicotiana sylvestris TaxID=4096 RepID=UPI00388C528A
MSLKIKEEVTKQVKDKVLRVVEYLTCLANIVPVPKKDGKKAIKGQALADHLAEKTMDEEYKPLKTYFPDEEIKHKNSTTYRTQMNGAIEAAKKNIKKILRKMIEKYKQWHEKLSFALLGYRTTVRTSIGPTPYMLVYGTEEVIPAEVEVPSLRIIQEAELGDAEWVKSRYEKLAFIDGKRMNAI